MASNEKVTVKNLSEVLQKNASFENSSNNEKIRNVRLPSLNRAKKKEEKNSERRTKFESKSEDVISEEKIIGEKGGDRTDINGSLINDQKIKSIYSVDIDAMSAKELHQSLKRLRENPVEPFTFLNHILETAGNDNYAMADRMKQTDIDFQLLGLIKRVELNKTLLERTNQRVKEINFVAEKNGMIISEDHIYDEKVFQKMKESGDASLELQESPANSIHPGIDELQRTMDVTLKMLDYVKKISAGETSSKELPELPNFKDSAKAK